MSGLEYRPAIDGMRAVAVVAVLLFHLDKRLLPGGFVGVDVFFVISGYLITSIIDGAARAGTFSMARFYQRRVARIFPVLFAVAVAVLAAAARLYTTQDFASAGALASAAVLSVANLKLMAQGDYFEASPDGQPFLHFWSLSVEEQFYVFFPALFVFAHRLRWSRRALLWVLGVAAAVSFVACVAVTATRPTWAFYLLPTRAWELLAGAILAVAAPPPDPAARPRNWTALVGLLLVLASTVVIDESRAFPGAVALLPVVGTVLLIGTRPSPRQWTERLLAHPWLVGVGKVSYSLYLWHWPAYCFVDYGWYASSVAARVTARATLTVALAVASYFVLERPSRAYLNAPRRMWVAFAGLAVGVLAVAAAGTTVRRAYYVDATVGTVAAGGVTFPAAPAAPTVVLMGDSNGSMYGTAMKSLAATDGLNVHVISVAAGDPFPGSRLYDESVRFLDGKRPAVTVFAAAWSATVEQHPERLTVALDEVLRHSAGVVLIAQPPTLPPTATRQGFRTRGVGPVYEEQEAADRRRRANELLTARRSDRVKVVPVDGLFLGADGAIMFADPAGRQLFQDRTHLSGVGAELVLTDVAAAIRELLGRPAGGRGE